MGRTEQLAAIQGELAEARRRAHDVAAVAGDAAWETPPAPGRWSAAQCLVHLNLTSRAFLPLIEDAIARGRGMPGGSGSHRMDVLGRLLWWASTLRLPVKTTEAFVPSVDRPRTAVLSDFDVLQDAVVGLVAKAEGLDLRALRVVSPFDARLTYNLYSCFRLIAAHQRQHLRQAEQALRR
ncbi:MAG: DinB family protein [Candidatus Rokubacteria bacterium]|nr:DinB family protein [Candidatus Rokubacteria bacterium]MBI3827382.1 DinB family protein [Candidatus Rokubacteria bacterium]